VRCTIACARCPRVQAMHRRSTIADYAFPATFKALTARIRERRSTPMGARRVKRSVLQRTHLRPHGVGTATFYKAKPRRLVSTAKRPSDAFVAKKKRRFRIPLLHRSIKFLGVYT
jgi:hypothetical protein